MAVVCLSPLPLASNRPLPWSLLSLLVGVLLLLWGGHRLLAATRSARVAADLQGPGDLDPRLATGWRIDRRAALLTLGFALLIAWYWVQASPDFSGRWAHPAWSEASAALGESLPAAISLSPAAGETLMMKIVAYGGILLLALQFGRDVDRARMAFRVICLCGFAYAIYGLVVHFTRAGTVLWFAKDAYPDSVTSTFINRNAYATYAGMALLAGFAPLLSELRRLRRDHMSLLGFLALLSERGSFALYLTIAAILTGFVAVVLTGSRAGVVCTVLGLAVFAIGLLIARDIRPRTFVVGALLGSAALAGMLLLSGGFLAKRLTTETAPEARAAVFDVARSAVKARPWTGQGLGGFGPAFNRANDGRAVFDTYVDLAHNSYLELAVEAGFPALLLNLALLGVVVLSCFRGLRARERGSSTCIAAIAIAALVGVHSLVDFGIQMPAVAATFMLLMGVAMAQGLTAETATVLSVTDPSRRFGQARVRRADATVATPVDVMETPPSADDCTPPGTRHNHGALSKETSAVAHGSPGRDDDYTAALARWRAVRKMEPVTGTTRRAEERYEDLACGVGPAGGAVRGPRRHLADGRQPQGVPDTDGAHRH